jgi:hypothetical protein
MQDTKAISIDQLVLADGGHAFPQYLDVTLKKGFRYDPKRYA